MIITEIAALITGMDACPFRLVQGAAELASLKDSPAALPAAYVLIKDEASAENQRMAGAVLQVTQCDFAVVIVTGNVADKTGGAASIDLQSLKDATRKALLGVMLPSAEDVVTHVSGSLVRAANGVLWWEEVFATSYLQEA